jgi:hypothetical protein
MADRQANSLLAISEAGADKAAGKKAMAAGDWSGAIALLNSAALRDTRNADIQGHGSGRSSSWALGQERCYGAPTPGSRASAMSMRRRLFDGRGELLSLLRKEEH